MNDVSAFAKEVKDVRRRFETCLASGRTDEALLEKINDLQKEEKCLLEDALPAARQKRLNRDDLHAYLVMLVSKPEQLAESGISRNEKQLCQKLLQIDYMNEPQLSYCPSFDPSRFACTFYMEVHNNETGFVFGDDGTVYLLENNHGWQYRRKPLFHDCFGEKAVMESSSSCLFLDLDKRIMRISYERLNTAEDLFREPYYG